MKCPLFSSDFNETRIFSTDFGKILKYQFSRKSVVEKADMFHADGRTDMMKLIFFFTILRTRLKMAKLIEKNMDFNELGRAS